MTYAFRISLMCRGQKNRMLHGEKQRILLVLLLVVVCACVCMCLSLRLLCLSVLYELHTQHPVSLAVLRGIWLSRCSKENPLFPLQDASVSGEKCYCRFALQAHTSGPAAQLCIYFLFFIYHIYVGWFCFTLFIFVLQEFILFDLSRKHSCWNVAWMHFERVSAFCAQWTLSYMGLLKRSPCICDAPWCIELILNPTHDSHSVLFPYLLGDICILSDFIKSETQHALVSHQSAAGMDDHTCTSGRWENKGVWSLVHHTD